MLSPSFAAGRAFVGETSANRGEGLMNAPIGDSYPDEVAARIKLAEVFGMFGATSAAEIGGKRASAA